MNEWTFEEADEDDTVGFLIKRGGKTVATTNEKDWAEIICAACNRDSAASRGNWAVAEPDIKF